MNKDMCKALRDDINKALEAIQKKYNVTCDLGTISYSSEEARVKLTISNAKEGSLDRYQKEYDLVAASHKTLIPRRGTTLSDGSVVYGWNAKARMYPVIVTKGDKKYKITEEHLISLMNYLFLTPNGIPV